MSDCSHPSIEVGPSGGRCLACGAPIDLGKAWGPPTFADFRIDYPPSAGRPPPTAGGLVTWKVSSPLPPHVGIVEPNSGRPSATQAPGRPRLRLIQGGKS